jgi:hypothetical protein
VAHPAETECCDRRPGELLIGRVGQALGREPIATAEGTAATAAILDDLLARRTIPGRPSELSDDLEWILAASGRAESGDNRLPLIG